MDKHSKYALTHEDKRFITLNEAECELSSRKLLYYQLAGKMNFTRNA